MKRKLLVITFAMLFVFGIVGTFWGPAIVDAAGIWNSCPRGEVNDAYPGECHDYIDTNGDNICDRSQSAPATTTTTAQTTTTTTTAKTTIASAVTTTTSNVDTSNNATQGMVTTTDTTASSTDTAAGTSQRSYHLIPIFLAVIILYGTSWILSTKKVFPKLLHRKIWNIILLVSAGVSAILGIVLILNIDHNANIQLPFGMLFWHVEAGIILGLIAFFHALWHWKYFTNMFNNSKNSVSK